ncbi:hypothetical protein MASR2M78_06020 [Treponema sp.]
MTGNSTDIDKVFTLVNSPSEINVGSLPINEALSVEVTALDGGGTLIGSWSGSVRLVAGLNPVPVVLVPPAASIIPLIIPTSNPELSLEIATLAPSRVRFYDLTFQGASSEWHIIADTFSGRFLYMEAYDAEWKKLDTIVTQSSQGWTVLAAGGGEHVRLAVANTLQAPGYPLSPATFTLQARKALFASPTASLSGTGLSTDPGLIQNSIEIPGISLFLKEGDYTIPGSGGLNIREDVQTYGSFSNASWKVRNTQTMRSWFVKETEGNGPTISLGNVGTPTIGRLDGIGVVASPIGATSSTTSALEVNTLASGANYLINDVIALGSRSGLVGGAYTANGIRLASADGRLEIASSKISGAASGVQGTMNVSSHGIIQDQGFAYIHNNDIDGGHAWGSTGNNVESAGILLSGVSSLSAVIASNRIWGGNIDVGGASSTSTAIHVIGPIDPANNLYIANNVISGGYSALTVASRVQGLVLAHSGSGNSYIVGNTLDGGSTISASPAYLIALRSMNYNQSSHALSNVLFASNGALSGSATRAAIEDEESASYFASFIGNTALDIGLPYLKGFSGTPSLFSDIIYGTRADNSSLASSPASFFRTFKADSFDADTWFASNDLRLSSGASPGSRVDVSLYIDPIKIAEYPALGLDAAGQARPSNGLWSRGAYE